MKVLAITGGIASGKSNVCRFFEDCGTWVLYADQLAHQVYTRGSPTYQKIVQRYGEDIIKEDGALNREKLAKILFNSASEKEWLEKEIHPATRLLIQKKIREAINQSPPLILVEAALHVETGYYKEFEGLIVVDINPEIQRERLIKRDGLSPEEAQTRIETQIPLKEKRKLADWVVDNSGTLEETKRQVDELYLELTK